VKLIALLAFLLASEDPAAVSGKVVDAITGVPLAKVQLRLEPLGNAERRQHNSATVSDGKGEFSFAGVEPGLYRLTGTRTGYLRTAYGARRGDAPGTTIRLESGGKVEALAMRMHPFAVIAGTVRDREGERQSGARVRLYKRQFDPHYNTRNPDNVAEAYTDDLGQYRFADLQPGKYYLEAEPPAPVRGIVDRTAGDKRLELDVRTLYPGVYDSSAAAPIEVAAGARITGVDVTLIRTRVFRIRGQAGSEPGIPAPRGVGITEGRVGTDLWYALSSEKVTNGAFEFPAVPPGTYTLVAWDEQGRWRHETRVPVTVGSSDVEGVRLTMGPGTEVTGNIRLEGEGKSSFSNFDLSFGCDGRGYGSNLTSEGTFAAYLYPARCEIHFINNSSDSSLYLKSAKAGEQDVLATGLTIGGPGKVRLDLVVSRDGGSVEGTASDAEYKAVSGATILLMPVNASAIADQNGRFEFKGVAPGEYQVLAFDDIEPGAWLDGDFWRGRESQGEKIAVRAKQKSVVRVAIRSK